MEKSGIQNFACFGEPATLGPRWTRWLMSFELYADGKGLILPNNATDAVKQRRRALLLHLAGPDVQDIFSTLANTGEATDYAAAVRALNLYFVPQVNAAFARQTFHKLTQNSGETIQQFATRLRQAARHCDYGGDADNQLRDAILSRCTSMYVKRKLLEEGPGLTLNRTLELASQCENVEEQMSAMSGATKAETETVHHAAQKGGRNAKYSKGKPTGKSDQNERKCYRCGHTDHLGRDPKCPAQTCHKCSGKDHFSTVCRTKPKGAKQGSEKGIGPTAERVRAVAEAREPENAAEVRSFLGLVGYSSRFIPQFATLSEPLRRLTRKDTPFEFGSEQREAFNALKNELARAGTLAYFDKDAQTKVIAGASPVGLGAVLVQVQQGEEVPICYVSRSLSDCERKYSQTERETLGLVWACERLHPYVYGRQFTLVTDHKPLEVIYGPHSKPCARIERWVLRLQPYDFKVLYIPGKQNIADSLSRLLGETAKRERHNHGSDEYVRFVAVSATPKALTTREVEEASATDPELIEVREAIVNGRFENCKAYAAIANELCVVGYLVLRGTPCYPASDTHERLP
ncbi:hypothetical protein SKAU_G00410880 [Synaphobranchus kaupii]|uniref:CCHC-type domain-containing protein n=1 Tax=Synaphobranchus kaupii TaxID=118154 RepID=A0A9Q1E7Q4_SYNKA|nr:hypothetical protein SKAU_G00410880 [Synaphobranchus kaupii]